MEPSSVMSLGSSRRVWRGTAACLLLVVFVGGAVGSPQEKVWVKDPNNPLIDAYPLGTRAGPCVLYEEGQAEPYVMYLHGDEDERSIFRSTSTDGVNWSTPVVTLSKATFANWSPWVIKDEGTYEMWYHAHNGIGQCGDSWIEHATSSDGINWTKDPNNPVLSPGDPFDDGSVRNPCVIKEGDTYKMWYTAADCEQGNPGKTVGYATSPDGSSWTKYPGGEEDPVPVLTGDGCGFDAIGVMAQGIYVEDGVYYLMYGGVDASGVWQLGLAWSTDGITFSRMESPLLPLGAPGDFDDKWTGHSNRGGASILPVGNEYWLWYGGVSESNNERAAIGLARSSPVLVSSDPAMDGTLCKVESNVISLTFDKPIALPADPNEPPLSIKAIAGGPELGSQFSYQIDPNDASGKTLKAVENGEVLTNLVWYRITPRAGFDVMPFVVDVATLRGDANNSSRITTADYSEVKAHMGEYTDARYDLNGSGRVTTADYTVAKSRMGDRAPAKNVLPPKPRA